MKMYIFYLFVFFGLSACSKTGIDSIDTDVNEMHLITNVDKVNNIVQDDSATPEGVGCAANYSKDRLKALKDHRFGTGLGLADAFSSILNNYEDCIGKSTTPQDPNQPTPVPDEPTPVPDPVRPPVIDDYSLFDRLQSYYPLSGSGTVLAQILSAYRLTLQEESIIWDTNLRMLRIFEKLPDDLFISYSYYDGNYYDNTKDILAILDILAGKNHVTASLYNQFIARDITESLAYPACVQSGGTRWVLVHDPDKILVPIVIPISIEYNTTSYVEYRQDKLELFTVDPYTIDLPSYPSLTKIFYNSTNGLLYSDSSFSSTIPNGYYWLPKEHPSAYERNNYIVHIQGGSIAGVYQ